MRARGCTFKQLYLWHLFYCICPQNMDPPSCTAVSCKFRYHLPFDVLFLAFLLGYSIWRFHSNSFWIMFLSCMCVLIVFSFYFISLFALALLNSEDRFITCMLIPLFVAFTFIVQQTRFVTMCYIFSALLSDHNVDAWWG